MRPDLSGQGILVDAVFESGLTIQYEANLSGGGGGGGRAEGDFFGRATVMTASLGSGMAPGMHTHPSLPVRYTVYVYSLRYRL